MSFNDRIRILIYCRIIQKTPQFEILHFFNNCKIAEKDQSNNKNTLTYDPILKHPQICDIMLKCAAAAREIRIGLCKIFYSSWTKTLVLK